jgi:hypothetical protein
VTKSLTGRPADRPGAGARFARLVFAAAGIWGLAILTPLYFLFDYVGRQSPPPITHPDFYYGFVAVALVWQVAFLLIARDPARFRPLMLLAMLEKFGYVATLAVLYAGGRLSPVQAAPAIPDLMLGVLFVAAFMRTPRSAPLSPS